MTRSELYDEVSKNLPSEYDGDYRQHLKKMLNHYVKFLKQLDENQRPKNWKSTLQLINKIKQSIIQIIEDTYKGLHSEAHSKFNKFIFYPLTRNYKSKTFYLKTYTCPVNTSWYRMRIFESQKHNLSHKHMFHIPLDRRGIVKTQRYSAPGYPCLYLGASIYTCWEEMHRPNLNCCFVSHLRNIQEIKLLDLTRPEPWEDKVNTESDSINYNENEFEFNQISVIKDNLNQISDKKIAELSGLNDLEQTNNSLVNLPTNVPKQEMRELSKNFSKKYNQTIPNDAGFISAHDDSEFISDIIRMPLILASMVMVKNSDDVFKPEYIIPQHIMESIIESIHNKELHFIGIYYNSVNLHKDFKFSFSHNDANKVIHQNNIAIPIQNPNSKSSYCDILCSLFEISDPACEEFELAKNPSDFLRTNSSEDDKRGGIRQYDYTDSVFYQLERRLLNESLFPLKRLP